MATGRKANPKVVRKFRLKKNDVAFDPNGWMVIKNPAIKRLIETRWLVEGVIPIPPSNSYCPRPKGPTPPSPDGMCACAFTLIGQEISRLRTGRPRTGRVRAGQLRTGPLQGTRRTTPR